MGRNILRILGGAVFAAVFSACDSNPKLFEGSDSFVAFQNATAVGKESDTVPICIPVVVGALKGYPAVSVSLDVVEDTAAAKEGVDFTLESKTLTFTDGLGIVNAVVRPIWDSVYTGNKTFKIRITSNTQNYSLGSVSEAIVTILDAEHPLQKWVGSYSVFAYNYLLPGAGDKTWSSVTTSSDPQDDTSLLVKGLSDSDAEIAASVNKDVKTMTIKAGSCLGNPYGIGDLYLYFGDPSTNTIYKNKDIVGEIKDDGSMVVDSLVVAVFSSGTYMGKLGIFKTTWTRK